MTDALNRHKFENRIEAHWLETPTNFYKSSSGHLNTCQHSDIFARARIQNKERNVHFEVSKLGNILAAFRFKKALYFTAV